MVAEKRQENAAQRVGSARKDHQQHTENSCKHLILLHKRSGPFKIHKILHKKSPQTKCLRTSAPQVGLEPTTLRLTVKYYFFLYNENEKKQAFLRRFTARFILFVSLRSSQKVFKKFFEKVLQTP